MWIHRVIGKNSDPWYDHRTFVQIGPSGQRNRESADSSTSLLYEGLINSLPVCIWVANEAGEVSFVNQRWSDYTGLTIEQSQGDGWLKAVYSEDRQAVLSVLRRGNRSGQPYSLEYRFWSAAGGIFRWHRGQVCRYNNSTWIGAAIDVHERREAEAEIRGLIARLQQNASDMDTMFRTLPIGIAIGEDADSQTIRVNSVFAEWLGLPPDSNASKSAPTGSTLPFHALRDGVEIPANDLPQQLAGRTGKEVRNYSFDLLREDAPMVHLLANAAPLFDGAGRVRGSIGAYVDLTEQRRIEASLRQSEAQLRSALQIAGIEIWRTRTSDFRTFSNPVIDSFFGLEFRAGGREANDYFERIHEEDVGRVRDSLARALSGHGPYVAEFRTKSRGAAAEHWLLARGDVLRAGDGEEYVLGVLLDITERKRNEMERRVSQQRLEARERELRTLAESIPQLVWTCLPDGRCDYLSPQWVNYTGERGERHKGFGWLTVVHPEDREATQQAWARAVAGRALYDVEFRLRRHDGEYRWFRARAIASRDEQGNVVRWFGTCTDIDDQKLAEEMMLQQQKLESIGLLAGGIAHDFNNLLTGVLGNASFISDALPADHELRPMARAVIESGQLAAQLTRQMLAYAGKGRLYVQRVDIPHLVRTTLDMVAASIPDAVRVALELDPKTPAVDADSGQVQQIVMNLIINAAESMADGASGTIRIRSGGKNVALNERSTADFQTPRAPKPGYYACIDVHDMGHGIHPADLRRIFDPFFTTKFTGRGLGLAAVQGIVRQAEGVIEVKTEVGAGTTFRVLMPAAVEQAEPKTGDSVSPDAARRRTGTVLVIDDDRVVRDLARLALGRSGYKVLLASGGQQGLQIFRENEQEISLILLDMSMPGMNGMETLAQLRKFSDTQVLVMSGYAETDVSRKFSGLEIAGVLQKPYTPKKLIETIDALH